MTNKGTAVTLNFSWLGLLGIVLVVLKALGYITWPWLWVLAPFWIPWAILGSVLVLAFVITVIADFYGRWRNRRNIQKRKDRFKKW